MGEYLTADKVRLETGGHLAMIRLLVEQPAGVTEDGWTLMIRWHMCFIRGPGDVSYGFLLYGVDGAEHWEQWVLGMGYGILIFGADSHSGFVIDVV